MKICTCLILPALLALIGCASAGGDPSQSQHVVTNEAVPAAAPQRVGAVSETLGEKIDNMVASRHPVAAPVTR